MKFISFVRNFALLFVAFSTLGACATKPVGDTPAARAKYEGNDPWERLNRATFNFSNAVDTVTLKPLAKGYQKAVPTPARRGIRNFLENVEEPWNFVNLLMQGKPKFAGEVLGRFVVNSTVGIAGFFDPATGWNLKSHDEDFGQTLAVWGVPEGPYLFVPLLGPSNPRDFMGFTAEFFGDPVSVTFDITNHENVGYGITAGEIVDTREALLDVYDPLLKGGGDPYVQIRSAYRQNRKFAISDGAIEDDEDDLFGDDPL